MLSNIDFVLKQFHKNGFAVIPDFFDSQEISDLKQIVHTIVEDMDMNHKTVYDTMHSDDYLITSNDKIRGFFEKDAFNEMGELVVDKHHSLNKLGHAMHHLEPTFRRITFSPKVQNIVKRLGFVKPRVTQSMFIFKNPYIGGPAHPHQDLTYLNVIPKTSEGRVKEMGVWFPLEDANEENGCLWFIPGSHKTGLHRQYILNPNGSEPNFVYTNDLPEYKDEDYVSAPATKGSVVLIDGLVVHKSAHNSSKYARPIYAFHIYDADSCDWDPKNWLQKGPGNLFPPLFTQ